MEFYNVFNNSYPLYELMKQQGWLNVSSYEEFEEYGLALEFFEGDPDMIKIGGDIGYFCKCRDNVYFYFDDLCGEAETMLKKFFDTYETGVTIGGEGYAIGVNPEGVRDVYGGCKDPQGRYIWDIWDEMETGIAFRGGGGYTYWISDWSEWFMTNVSTIK